MKGGVYAINNTVDGRQYIGSSTHLEVRIQHHKHLLEHNRHYNRQLQAAYNQYGASAFTFTVLEYVDSEHLRERESYWLNTLPRGYNTNSVTGRPFIGDMLNADRFWSKVDIRGPDDCWLWTSRINKHGYGQVYQAGMSRTVSAHRAAWEVTNGPIPPGMHVLHRCDVRNCVNPAHLFIGTNADNMHDKAVKGRVKRLKGTANGRALLVDVEVKAIRRMYATGRYTQAQLGRIHGVSKSTIEHILGGKRWRHVR